MKGIVQTAALILTMLVLGSFNTINSKLMFQTDCPSLAPASDQPLPTYRKFDKPWLTNLMMFVGEASLLLVFMLRRRWKKRKYKADDHYVLLNETRHVPAYYFALPAGCDVLGTGIGAVAMMNIDASVWQMMRGAIIVFSTILTVLFLRRRLLLHHWIGVVCTVIGLILVGLSAILDENATQRSGGKAAYGVTLIILAQIFSAFQMVFEEYLLTGYEVSSIQTVGMEGVWGCGFMWAILLVMNSFPGEDHGVYESLPDGSYMILGSSQMQILVSSYMLSIACYNYTGMQLCRKLSAVTRCLVDCLRTAVIWFLQLAMHYGVSETYGNAWTNHSWLQLAGFALLVFGTLVYNNVLKCSRGESDVSRQAMLATWSPTVNRAAAWGHGPSSGPQSPHAPESPLSPLPPPFSIGPESNPANSEFVISEIAASG